MKIVQCTLRRWAATTTKTTLRSIISRPLVLPFSAVTESPAYSVRRPFSSPSESKSILLEILGREEQEEEGTGNTELPTELLDLKKTIEKSWKIVESGATTDLYMIESPSNNKIQVSFHCQDTIEIVEEADFDDNDDEEGLDHEDDDEDDEVQAPGRFTVTITKNGKSLVFACFSEFGDVKIEGVSTTDLSTVEYVHANQGTLPKTEYQGPDFTELAEDLQDALAVYLDEECGVNSDIATFIAMFTDYREEIQYVDFLKQAQSIVSS
mmetsp:Transcript_6086/g.6826  ORF Transcript_6086/g.6826 Transcript_6086/m.6826 type:complete len:267 (+) Transcript_6086:28-828(+)